MVHAPLPPGLARSLLWPLAVSAAVVLGAGAARSLELGLPADCAVGEDCFFQQYSDMDPGPDAVDAFCGAATFDGHDGTDLRVLSMADVKRGVPVVAVADGTVLRLRDGEPDRLVSTEADRAAVADKECGNGIILEHADGYQTQYCHLRRGSITVKPGDTVERGQKFAEIGASGMAQFPHVHVTVRRNGEAVDPVTGRALSQGCLENFSQAEPLFAETVIEKMEKGESGLLAMGLAGTVIDHATLSAEGPPPTATPGSAATVGWAWFSNLRTGDRIAFRVDTPDGSVLTEHTTEPVERTKADYSAYAGKRGGPEAGTYTVTVKLLRDGEAVLERSADIIVE